MESPTNPGRFNGVAYGCSQDADGTMFALDGATGAVLWDFPSGVACNSGAAIADGKVYWTTGYSAFTGEPPPGSVKLYVFALAH
jgi:polyvinyl alcohol dehydrogenase (cytochrome)